MLTDHHGWSGVRQIHVIRLLVSVLWNSSPLADLDLQLYWEQRTNFDLIRLRGILIIRRETDSWAYRAFLLISLHCCELGVSVDEEGFALVRN